MKMTISATTNGTSNRKAEAVLCTWTMILTMRRGEPAQCLFQAKSTFRPAPDSASLKKPEAEPYRQSRVKSDSLKSGGLHDDRENHLRCGYPRPARLARPRPGRKDRNGHADRPAQQHGRDSAEAG